MTTAKKILTLALCLTCLTAGMTGCAKDKSSSDTKIAKSTSSQSKSSDSEKIKELSDKLEKLENTLSDILGEDIFDPADGDGNVNGEIHLSMMIRQWLKLTSRVMIQSSLTTRTNTYSKS